MSNVQLDINRLSHNQQQALMVIFSAESKENARDRIKQSPQLSAAYDYLEQNDMVEYFTITDRGLKVLYDLGMIDDRGARTEQGEEVYSLALDQSSWDFIREMMEIVTS